jgi:hypothetical protein
MTRRGRLTLTVLLGLVLMAGASTSAPPSASSSRGWAPSAPSRLSSAV